jgi:hypothetical protein
MSVIRCPGSSKTTTPKPLERACPRCGAAVEIWSDEEKAFCKCGAPVFRNRDLTCVAWCSAAEQCLGDKVDVARIKAEAQARAAREGNPRVVQEVMELVRKRRGACAGAKAAK